MINYYKLLEIANFSDLAAIKNAYRKKAKQYHPDIATNSNKSENEEIFKWINLANATLSNPAAKLAYDQKLRGALAVDSIQTVYKKKSKLNKEDLFELAEKEKKREVESYQQKDQQFSYNYRIALASASILLGLYFCYENWYFTIDEYGVIFIVIGFVLFFISTLFLTQLVYRKLRITSFNKKGYYKFYESISVYGFTLLMIIGPLMVILFSNIKKNYHLHFYGKEVIAKKIFIDNPGVSYQFTTKDNELIRKNQTMPEYPKVSKDNFWILIRYSTKDPRIAEIMTYD